MAPRLVLNRFKSAIPRSRDHETSREKSCPCRIDVFRAWHSESLKLAVKPLAREIDLLKKAFLEERKQNMSRLASLEDDVRNITSILSSHYKKKSPRLRSFKYGTHNDVSLDSLNRVGGSSESFFHNDDSPLMIDVQRLELQLQKSASTSASMEELHHRCSDDIDKTGFSRIRTRALMKAFRYQGLTTGPTIGPRAVHNGGSVDTGLDRFAELNDTRLSKTSHNKEFNLSANPIADEIEPLDEERLCRRRILAEIDKLTQIEAQEAKYQHIKEWEEHDKRAMEEFDRRSALQQAEDLARQQAKMLEMAQRTQAMRREQEVLAAQQAQRELEMSRKNEETRKLQLEAERIRKEKMKQRNDLFNRVYEIHQTFITQYKEILELMSKEEGVAVALAQNRDIINSCQQKFSGLIEKCKLDLISEDEVACTQGLLDTISVYNVKAKEEMAKIQNLRAKEQEELENIKKIEEEKKKQKQEEERKIEEERKLSILQHSGKVTSPSSSSGSSAEAVEGVIAESQRYQEYQVLKKHLEKTEESLLELTRNDSLKKFRMDCQKAINVSLNAISAQSESHMLDKHRKLLSFLQKQPIIVSDKRVTAAAHPLGSLYSLNYLAMKTVKQGDCVVSSNPEAAYPIAAIVVALWNDLPEFGQLLRSQFYKASPYLIPAYWEQKANETDEQYYKRLGFTYSNNEIEDMDQFLKRQGGIIRLYWAIVVTPQNRANKHKPHPLPVSEAWKWLTAFIKLPPKADISASTLLLMLEVTGNLMMSKYNAQFCKLLHLICKSYLPLIEKVTPTGRGGPVTRLRGFLEGLISGKSIPPPKGLLSPNFW